MNILIYYQNNYHTVFLESLAESFISKGHKVYFYTICKEGILHHKMASLGVNVFYSDNDYSSLYSIIGNTYRLIRFCQRNKIDVVFSHLQIANLVALVAQFFIKTKIFPCRHHSDQVMLKRNKNAMRLDNLVNTLSNRIIVVSNAVKDQMTTFESVKDEKIEVISLGYNFDLYDKVSEVEVKRIKDQYPANFYMIMIGRMVEEKGHLTAFEVCKKLVSKGYDVKLFVLDKGPLLEELKSWVSQNDLADKIIFTGFLNNAVNYIAASNILIHPSITEASNQVVKEAAIQNVPSVVCEGVGDFDEYIINEKTGLKVSKENAKDEMYEVMVRFYSNKENLINIGKQANLAVRAKFDIKIVSERYLNTI
jgi:glycosyltransferase involved in cell wall biosynthesis